MNGSPRAPEAEVEADGIAAEPAQRVVAEQRPGLLEFSRYDRRGGRQGIDAVSRLDLHAELPQSPLQ